MGWGEVACLHPSRSGFCLSFRFPLHLLLQMLLDDELLLPPQLVLLLLPLLLVQLLPEDGMETKSAKIALATKSAQSALEPCVWGGWRGGSTAACMHAAVAAPTTSFPSTTVTAAPVAALATTPAAAAETPTAPPPRAHSAAHSAPSSAATPTTAFLAPAASTHASLRSSSRLPSPRPLGAYVTGSCDLGGGGGVGWAARVAVVGRTLADGAADSAHTHAHAAATQPA